MDWYRMDMMWEVVSMTVKRCPTPTGSPDSVPSEMDNYSERTDNDHGVNGDNDDDDDTERKKRKMKKKINK